MNNAKKRDELLEFYKTDDFQKTIYLLLKESEKLKAGEMAVRGLMMGDLWKFEFIVTKLREIHE